MIDPVPAGLIVGVGVLVLVLVLVVAVAVLGVVDKVWTTMNAATERTANRMLGQNSIVKIWQKNFLLGVLQIFDGTKKTRRVKFM